MRFKRIEDIKPGERTGADLFDLNGRVVVSSKVILTKQVIDRLIDQGYAGLYIDDQVSSDIQLKPVINNELRLKARNSVKHGDIEEAITIAKDIVSDIVEHGIVALDMNELKKYDDYTYIHSVNVAVLACMLGFGMDLPERELDDLVLAGLLHDLGKYKIPAKLINKSERLTKDEFDLLKKHSTFSYDIIADRNDISMDVKNAVLLHHENEDGSGYPMGILGSGLNRITKILHVVDIYDALIQDKPYKKGYTPWEAAEYLMGACGYMFDKNVVDTFIRVVPLYQKGSEIVLSTGEHAIVLENSGENNLRPKIRLIDSHKEINLAERKYITLTFYTGDEWEHRKQVERERDREKIKKGIAIAKKRLLVVDDMKMNRVLLKGILEKEYELKFAESGEEAVNIIRTDKRFDLVLMDIDMPGMSGTDAAREINSITDFRIPILFVSAIRDVQTVILCRELKAAGYITRPYQTVYMLTEIDRIIHREW